MIRPRTVGDTWTVPPALAALVAAGMLGAIVTVYTGNHDQATPKVATGVGDGGPDQILECARPASST